MSIHTLDQGQLELATDSESVEELPQVSLQGFLHICPLQVSLRFLLDQPSGVL